MDRYLEVIDVDVTMRRTYEGYIRLHVRPLLGKLPLGKLDALKRALRWNWIKVNPIDRAESLRSVNTAFADFGWGVLL